MSFSAAGNPPLFGGHVAKEFPGPKASRLHIEDALLTEGVGVEIPTSSAAVPSIHNNEIHQCECVIPFLRKLQSLPQSTTHFVLCFSSGFSGCSGNAFL